MDRTKGLGVECKSLLESMLHVNVFAFGYPYQARGGLDTAAHEER